MAGERSIVEEAWPGDIVGLYDPGKLRLGDTLSAGEVLRYHGIPRFAPEHFARVVLEDPMKRKQLDSGLEQLSHEGVIQVFVRPDAGRQSAWLGAVGLLQFEVLKERLKNEYRVHARMRVGRTKCFSWNREHPLTPRHVGQHTVDPAGGGVCHSSAPTRRTESTSLAGERDQQVVLAGGAADPDEAVGENPALEEPLHFRPNVGRQPSAGRIGVDQLQERLHVCSDRPVQRRVLGAPTPIPDRLGGGSAAGGGGDELPMSKARATALRRTA